tara:strand:- start:836 stop:1255 length:420 start_codon:yes stop_codon:yes gene_type:complete
MKTKISNGKEYIFDIVRKKYILNQPEEWVRQNIIQYLSNEKGYPISLMSIEKKNEINSSKKRTDIICYNNHKKPLLLIECKAMHVKINPKTFQQTIIYQHKVQAKYILITNGKEHYCFQNHPEKIEFLDYIPDYEKIKD